MQLFQRLLAAPSKVRFFPNFVEPPGITAIARQQLFPWRAQPPREPNVDRIVHCERAADNSAGRIDDEGKWHGNRLDGWMQARFKRTIGAD